MGKLFNRDCDPVIDQAFSGFLAEVATKAGGTPDPEAEAIIQNFRADERVSQGRQNDWLAKYRISTKDDVEEAISKYYKEWVLPSPDATFLHKDNEHNLVYRDPDVQLLVPGTALVTCLDLTNLHPMIVSKKGLFADKYFGDYPTSATKTIESETHDWHKKKVEKSGERDHLEHFVEALSDYANRDICKACRAAHPGCACPSPNPGSRRNPVWVTDGDKVGGRLEKDQPDEWLSILGLAQFFKPLHWLALFRYPAHLARNVVRPSCLDAGYYQYHFPSPPTAKVSDGGHPMDLQGRFTPLIPEYIHEQTHSLLSMDYWLDGYLHATSDSRRMSDTPWLRERHTEVLEKTYPGARAWLDSAK